MDDKRTHYQQDGKKVAFDYYTMNADPNGGVFVYGWGTYGRHSVLAGQTMKQFLTSFDSSELAIEVYGEMNFSSKFTEPENTFDHLPDEGDGW